MNKDDLFYKIDNIKPTDEQKDKMLNNISLKLNKDKDKKLFNSKSFLSIASILILLITTGMVVYNQLDMNFLTFLNNKSIYKAESLESYIYDVNKTIKDKNGDLKIKQVLGDENITYIFMELESKNGQSFNVSKDVNDDGPQDYWFDTYNYDTYNYTAERFSGIDYLSGGSGLRMVNTDKPNSLGIVTSIDSNDKLYKKGSKGYNYSFEFKDLIKNTDGFESGQVILPGSWKGQVKLNHQVIPSYNHKINKTIDAYGENFYIENIKISPLSMTLYSKIDKNAFETIEREMNKNNKSVQKFNIMNEDFFIKTKDGKLHKLYLDSGNANHMSSEMVLTFTFSEPIELKQMDSIVLLGQEMPLN